MSNFVPGNGLTTMKKRKRPFYVLALSGLLSLLSLPFNAQVRADVAWERFVEQWTDEVGEGLLDESQLSLLTEWHAHPLNLNNVSRSELELLPFLDTKVIDNLLYYALKHQFHSLDELLFIPALTPIQQRLLRLFVSVEAPMPEQQISSSILKTDVTTRLNVPCYDRVGWDCLRGIANSIKYVGKYGTHWEWGLHVDKDAGEPMFTRTRPLWDSHGGFAAMKAISLGGEVILKELIVGDYKVGFGEGVVINNAFSFGKGTMGTWRTTSGITPHRSTDEYHFLRGIAATFAFSSDWKLTAFYSYRQLDAAVASNNTVATIAIDGLHRTIAEQQKHHTVNTQTLGAHLSFSLQSIHAGITATYNYFDHVFQQNTALYRQIYPQGFQFGAVSVNYGYGAFPFYFRGETARSFDSRGGDWATLNKFMFRFNSTTQISLLPRYYGQTYFSPHAAAFGEESNNRNEHGAMLLFEADRLGDFGLKTYFDFYYSPYPRYTMTHSSNGWEMMLQGSWQPHRNWMLQLRYQCKSKESNDRRHYAHRLRGNFRWQCSTNWALQFAALYQYYNEPVATSSHGFAFFPRVDFNSADSRWRWSFLAGIFATDDYSTCVYHYEPSLFQSYGMQMLYGHGERIATTIRYHTLSRHFDIQLKAGMTHQRDRDSFSSGALKICSPVKLDLEFLLRVKY